MTNFNINLNKFSLGISIFQPPSLHSILYLLYPFIFLIPKTEYSLYLFLWCIITSLYSTIEYHLSLSCVKIFSWSVLNYCPWWILEQPLRFIFLINKLPFYLNFVMLQHLCLPSTTPEPFSNEWNDLAEFWWGLLILIPKKAQTFPKVACIFRTSTS